MEEEVRGFFAPVHRALTEANRLNYGLAAYAYTKSSRTMAKLGQSLESGMVSINHMGIGLPEVPHGGIKDSGFGSEGGAEALEGFFNNKLVTQLAA
jgi:succinate-semialdehyde dehydrogenase/glutarate-semialdehyde dehydrogenase